MYGQYSMMRRYIKSRSDLTLIDFWMKMVTSYLMSIQSEKGIINIPYIHHYPFNTSCYERRAKHWSHPNIFWSILS